MIRSLSSLCRHIAVFAILGAGIGIPTGLLAGFAVGLFGTGPALPVMGAIVSMFVVGGAGGGLGDWLFQRFARQRGRLQ
jgi:hypothetical protein